MHEQTQSSQAVPYPAGDTPGHGPYYSPAGKIDHPDSAIPGYGTPLLQRPESLALVEDVRFLHPKLPVTYDRVGHARPY